MCLNLKRTYSYHPTCKFKINTIKNEELSQCLIADSRRQVLNECQGGSAGHTQEPKSRPAGKWRDAVNLLSTGRAKKSFQVFPLHLMEKPTQTFWPTQYFLGLMMF